MSLHAATIGSINIDYLVDLSEVEAPDSFFLDGHIVRPIETVVGGNGSFFAEAALDAGFTTSKLFTTVGSPDGLIPDALASMAIEYLKAHNIDVFYSLDKGNQTGRVIMVYYSNNRRFVMADRSAGDSFHLDNLPPNIYNLLENIDLLYVSGYGLQTKQRCEALQTLMQYVHEKGTFVLVDVVPHQVYKSIPLSEYKKFLTWADAIAVEGPTIKGFLGYKDTKISSDSDIAALERQLRDLCEVAFVRLNDKSDFLITTRDSNFNVHIPFPANRAGRRFMDKILAHFLNSFLTNGRSLRDDGWVSDVTEMINSSSSSYQ